MATVERIAGPHYGGVRTLLLGRVLPHAGIAAYIFWYLSVRLSTVNDALPAFFLAYTVFTAAHTVLASRNVRFGISAAGTAGLTLLIILGATVLAPHSEAGSFVAGVTAVFLIILLWISCVVNHWFIAARAFYIADVAAVNGTWIAFVLPATEFTTAGLIAASLPVVVYSLYVLLFDYALRRPMPRQDRRKIVLRYLLVVLVLAVAAFIGSVSGIGDSAGTARGSYSLLSKKNDRFRMQDRAALEDEFKLPIDSKELVFAAHVPAVSYQGYSIGAPYLKFHSLHTYDPARNEFNGLADEMEAPTYRVRLVPLDRTMAEPVQLTVGLDGREVTPPEALRFDGRSTIYNVRLSTDQTFGHNLTYRFVSYSSTDSVTVADETLPVLGVHRLFSRVSILNVIPIGTAGQFFQFDYNAAVLDRVDEYGDVDGGPRGFRQQYLGINGLEQDILDTMRALLRGRENTRERIETVIGFFTQRDATGQPVFTYSLKPGKSADPNESLLHYFLLKNRRAYCTYYATAAALFFRAAGIPARVAIGFVPGEESKQTPGWYYVYSNQAHAWTEIWLGPSLGWIDIDLTPAAEGPPGGPPPPSPTPPEPPMPLDAQYRVTGVVETAGDALTLRHTAVYERTEERDTLLRVFPRERRVPLRFDVSVETQPGMSDQRARVTDVVEDLRAGDSVVATGHRRSNAAFAESRSGAFQFHTIAPLSRMRDTTGAFAARRGGPDGWWTKPSFWIMLVAVWYLLLHLVPALHLGILARRTRRARSDARRLAAAREWLLLKLHLFGTAPERETDLEFAVRTGAVHGVDVTPLVTAYLRYRYDGGHVAPHDARQLCTDTMAAVDRALRVAHTWPVRLYRQIHLWNYMRYINRRKTA